MADAFCLCGRPIILSDESKIKLRDLMLKMKGASDKNGIIDELHLKYFGDQMERIIKTDLDRSEPH